MLNLGLPGDRDVSARVHDNEVNIEAAEGGKLNQPNYSTLVPQADTNLQTPSCGLIMKQATKAERNERVEVSAKLEATVLKNAERYSSSAPPSHARFVALHAV